jgi:indolepyruvate ferredoxin oxidoreductase
LIDQASRIEDRYLLEDGSVLLSGVQAAIRIPFDRMRADVRAGLHTASLISGYPGSPLGGLDIELAKQQEHLDRLGIVHRRGLNEDLAATSVWGSQQIAALPGPKVEGVLGLWYGKAPGVDRSGDSLRHGALGGAHPKGGLLALCGDDPGCKSSTIPSASERLLSAFGMPVLVPGDPQEVLDLGLHAVAMSRMSGCWPALKITSNVADAVATVTVGRDRISPTRPEVLDGGELFEHAPSAIFAPPGSIELERTLRGPRLEIVREYARLNELNRIVLDPAGARVGILAAGTAYFELREALLMLGLDEAALAKLGVRILKVGLVWPLEPTAIKQFARGLDEIFVVEEKGPFLESAIRDILYGVGGAPAIVGQRDNDGRDLVPSHGALNPDLIALALCRWLEAHGEGELVAAGLAKLEAPEAVPVAGNPPRIPFFCSGCPHNRSTDVPDGTLVGAGIGCHTMVALSPVGKGAITGLTQMGGEGAQWLGQEPFVEAGHLVQNLGDGTFHHSASLAIRAAAAAEANITYKILYNSFISMTGGQVPEGQIGVADLTRWLEIEGARQIIITTDDVGAYKGVRLAPIAEVRDRAELVDVHGELREVPGVTVHIHDQGCAAELRRLRKRGKVPEPAKRAFINERVCEGCGDCGRKSHCLSVVPVETEFGPKTEIHQPSCNKDFSCLDGDCPSFLEVIPGKRFRKRAPTPPAGMPEPRFRTQEEATLRLIGIGGTGVVTVAQVLAMAAKLDGRRTLGLDQTGLAQKGGTVTSDVRLLPAGEDRASRPGTGGIDVLLGFDLLASTSPSSLQPADAERTVAVLSTTQVPTAQMIGNPDAHFAELTQTLSAVEATTRREDNLYLDATALSEGIFADHMQANTLLLGAAWQQGLIPISHEAIEQAYRLNGVAVDSNLAAFEWGRSVVAKPEAVETAISEGQPERSKPPLSAADIELIRRVPSEPGSSLEQMLEIRVPDLVAYQHRRYAERYVAVVARAFAAEKDLQDGFAATEAVARQLHHLMAYKDEYEVARLHLDPVERARIRAEFGDDAKIHYLLHPPALRALGMNRKVRLGKWFDPGFAVLRSMKRLRGTPLDPFGRAEVRRIERRLVDEYIVLVEESLPMLGQAHAQVTALFETADQIRGYEEVKLGNVAAYRERVSKIREDLQAAAPVAGAS